MGPYLLEFEGKVLTVNPPKSYEPDSDKRFMARELMITGENENEAALVRRNDMDLSNKPWFLGPFQSFCARMMGQKVCRFKFAPQWEGQEHGRELLHCVHCHDLLKKKFRLLTPDAFSAGYGWVDLGGVMVTRYRRIQA